MKDKAQIGLTSVASDDLTRVMTSGWFADRQQAYRTAIAVALSRRIAATEEEMTGITTAYNFVGGVDKDGQLRALIAVFAPEESSRPAAYSERLAHAGLAYLAKCLVDDALSLGEVLAPVSLPEGAETGA